MRPVISPSKTWLQPSSNRRRSSSHARQIESARYSTCAASRSRSEVCSASSSRSVGRHVVRDAELPQQRPVHDQVGVAADGRGEVAVGAAREPGVAEVLGVVARPLERAQHEGGKGLAAAAARLHVLGHPLRDRGGERGRVARAQPVGVGRRRRRHAEVGQLGDEQEHRLRVGALVHAVEGLAPPAGEELGDLLVGEDHQLLDEHVRLRLPLEARVRDAAAAVEGEDELRRLDPQRAACEPPPAQLGGQPVGEAELLGQLGRRLLPPGEDGLGPAVREALAAADDRAVEGRLAGLQGGAEGHLRGHGEPVLVRAQAADVLRQRGRKHRRHAAGHVGRERAALRAAVERRAGRDEVRDVRDVHPRAQAVALADDRDRRRRSPSPSRGRWCRSRSPAGRRGPRRSSRGGCAARSPCARRSPRGGRRGRRRSSRRARGRARAAPGRASARRRRGRPAAPRRRPCGRA